MNQITFLMWYFAMPRCHIRYGPFDIQGGWDFFEKKSLFPNISEKNKMSSTKLKIKVCSSFSEFFFEALFPVSYKGLHITQKLTCIIL